MFFQEKLINGSSNDNYKYMMRLDSFVLLKTIYLRNI